MTYFKTLLGASALTLLAVPALAATTAVATTDLNVRAGPGPQYPVQGVIGVNQQTVVDGCLDSSKWCRVSMNGQTGWAYSEYLVADHSGQPTVIYQNVETIGVPVVSYEGTVAEEVPPAGTLVAGPNGEPVEPIAPDPVVQTYVVDHPVDPVYLDGEVVIGSEIPEAVTLHEIPEEPYRYVYLNGQEVLVAPDTRQIVYVYR